MEDVIPFLENVLRGRNVPRERMLMVAEHYYLFGGVSPINQKNRQLIAALSQELEKKGPRLPVYWGNRNWHPLLPDTVRQMRDDGVKHALAFVTSAYSSYSSCRQYLDNIATAREAVGPGSPQIEKLRAFYNHPGFIRANAENVRTALGRVPVSRRAAAQLVFTAHSIPLSMAQNCRYQAQLNEAARLVAEAAAHSHWKLAFQSRSGAPGQPWLEPDILELLKTSHESGVSDVVLAPIGFVSDHMEVVYDLDVEAKRLSEALGINLQRAETASAHPAFVQMIRELIVERMNSPGNNDRPGENCAIDCCRTGT